MKKYVLLAMYIVMIIYILNHGDIKSESIDFPKLVEIRDTKNNQYLIGAKDVIAGNMVAIIFEKGSHEIINQKMRSLSELQKQEFLYVFAIIERTNIYQAWKQSGKSNILLMEKQPTCRESNESFCYERIYYEVQKQKPQYVIMDAKTREPEQLEITEELLLEIIDYIENERDETSILNSLFTEYYLKRIL